MKQVVENVHIRLYKTMSSYILTNPEILYKFKRQNLTHLISKLEVLNPMNTLKRGYAIVKKDNKVISDIQKVKKDDIINIDVKNGHLNAQVLEVTNE